MSDLDKVKELRDKYYDRFERIKENKGIESPEAATADIKREALQEAVEVLEE